MQVTVLKIRRRRHQGKNMKNQSEVHKLLSKLFIKNLPK